MIRADAAALAAAKASRGFGPTLNTLGFSAPLQWLALGRQDLRRAPGIGLFYRTCFMTVGWAL